MNSAEKAVLRHRNKRGAHVAGEAFLSEGWLRNKPGEAGSLDFRAPSTVQTFDPGVLPGVREAGASGNLAIRAGQARPCQEDVLQRERAKSRCGTRRQLRRKCWKWSAMK